MDTATLLPSVLSTSCCNEEGNIINLPASGDISNCLSNTTGAAFFKEHSDL